MRKFLILFMLGIFLVPLAMAGNVAYIYGNEKIIDMKVVGILNEMSEGVDLVDCKDVAGMDFSGYNLIVVSDDRLRKCVEDLPVDEIGTVVMNRYYGKQLGITGRESIRQIGSNAPLEIVDLEEIKQAYDRASGSPNSIPMYYMRDYVRVGFEKIASVHKGMNKELGASIVYIHNGNNLVDGRFANENICFFGITKSKYWTADSEMLFRDCVDFAMRKVHDVSLVDFDDAVDGIKITDEDGNIIEEGVNLIYGNKYKVYFKIQNEGDFVEDIDFEAESCINWTPTKKTGLVPEDSVIKYNTINFTCAPGDYQIKINAMIEDDEHPEDNEVVRGINIVMGEEPVVEELVHDVMLDDLKITDINETLVEDGMLIKGEDYQILIDLTNVGNYTENVTFIGEIKNSSGNVVDTFTHQAVPELEAGDKKNDKSKTVNFDFVEGVYVISIEAVIDVDEHPEDNEVVRQITIVMEGEEPVVEELVHDVGFEEDYDGFGNYIRIKGGEESVILEDPIQVCEEEIDIQFRTINKGNYSEDVNISCEIKQGSIIIDFWNSIKENLTVDGSTTSGNKNNYNFSEYENGNYEIVCNLDIVEDDNIIDNSASRNIEVLC